MSATIENSQPSKRRLHLSSAGPIVVAGIWLALSTLFYIFGVEGSLVTVSFLLLYWIGSLVLFVILLWGLASKVRRAMFPTIYLSAILFLIAGSIMLLNWGTSYGFLVKFQFEKPRYEKTIEELKNLVTNDQVHYFGEYDVIVDQGPPRRYAFTLPGGLLDNFQAVVYDPTGFVMQTQRFGGSANSTSWDDPALKSVKQLFGGDMFRCDPLEGAWYLCWFT